MPRSVAFVVATLALAAGGLGVTGCSSAATSPTVPRKNFTPKAEIIIGCPPGERCAPAVASKAGLTIVAPNSINQVDAVPDHATVVVKNLASGIHRVTGTIKDDQLFDTGQMASGNTTTVVLQTPGRVTITDTTTGEHVTLTVRSAPAVKA
jgi:hypothetical protein